MKGILNIGTNKTSSDAKSIPFNNLVCSYTGNIVNLFDISCNETFYKIELAYNSNGYVQFMARINGAYSSLISNTGSLSTGQWYHAVMQRDIDGGYLKLYLNGIEVDFNSGISTASFSPTIRIGAEGSSGYLNGAVDDFAIWNGYLNANSIWQIYNGGDRSLDLTNNYGNYTDSNVLKGYWRMNEGSGSQAQDISGQGNHGTLTGANWLSLGPVYHVSTSGSDSNNGLSSSPFATIQKGIDAASSGDTILVQPGTYSENLDIQRKLSVTIGSLYLTTGDTSHIRSTIINGGGNGPTIFMKTWDNYLDNYGLASLYLKGVTLTGGAADEDIEVPCSPCNALNPIDGHHNLKCFK